MACDQTQSFWLMYTWSAPGVFQEKWLDPPTNTVPNVRPFSDPVGGTGWVEVLRLTPNQFCQVLDTQPAWFQQTSTGTLVTSWNMRTGDVFPATGDYTYSQVT